MGGTGTAAPGTVDQTSGVLSPAGVSSTEDADFASAAATYGVPANLLKAVASTESGLPAGGGQQRRGRRASCS